jgi:hypothetical protein
MSSNIEIREANLDDLPFIYSTWLRSYRYASQFAKKLSNAIFYEMHHKVIDGFISRGGRVSVAHPVGEPGVILGYICVEANQPLIQYVYVKKSFRKLGIAKSLYNAQKIPSEAIFTHWTSDTDWIIKKINTLTYNPYLI